MLLLFKFHVNMLRICSVKASILLSLCLCIYHCECLVTNSSSMNDLKNLYTNLQNGYDARVTPRHNRSSLVRVESSFTLLAINAFDISVQRMDFTGFFTFQWLDESLVWDPDEYDGINLVKLSVEEVWHPDMYLTSAGVGREAIGVTGLERVDVTSNGNVVWIPERTHALGCGVSVKYYPFDQQTCFFAYYIAGETSTSTIQLHILEDTIGFQYFENSEWELVKVTTHLDAITHDARIAYVTITMDRRPQFAVYTLVIPLIALSALNAFTLLLPIESGEKGSLSITIFLTFAFFISLTKEELPRNSNEVSYYLVYMTVLLLYSVLVVVYVIIEGRINAQYGTKLYKKTRMWGRKKIKDEPVNEDIKTNDANEASNNETFTWSDCLKTVDIIACIVSILFLLIFSSSMLGTMINRGQ